MDKDNYTVEVVVTPQDIAFTEQAQAAGLPLILISAYRTALQNLVAAEREACAQIAFNAKTYLEAAAAIRARGQE